MSYDIYKKHPERYLKESGADTVISDESHRGKNEATMLTDAMKRARKLYKNHLALTGSAISNTPSDIHPLIDVTSGGQHSLGKNKEEFEKKFVRRHGGKQYQGLAENRKPIVGFRDEKTLRKDLDKYVDYVDFDDIKDLANMPGKKMKVKKVQISKEQAKMYKKILRSDPAMMKMITQKRLETLKDDETARAFNKLIEARKLMNSIGSVKPGMDLAESAFKSPKTKQLLDDLQAHLGSRKDAKALLFSHLISGGVDTLEAGLKERGIDYGEFIGKGNKGVTEETRQQDITNYNKGKKKVMVISSAGGEGLSLDDTTWEGVLDPHYNPEKMKQMEARGIRSGGLAYLPKEQRNVEVNRYLATMPKFLGLIGSSIRTPDEFIYDIAQHKDEQNQKLYNILKDVSKKRQQHLLLNRQITTRTEIPDKPTYEP
jgi:SNF2 family DNA or RNA helicase